MTIDIAEIVSAYTAAWNSGSAEAVASFYAPEGKGVNVITGADGWAVMEFLNRGTQTGPPHSSLGEFPTSGRKVEVHYCSVMRVPGGKVVEGRDHYDSASIARQLGLVA